MPIDIRNHPDAPDPELFQQTELVVEPVPLEEIRQKREDGYVLVEDNVRERDDLNVMAYISEDPKAEETQSIGVALYRLCQLFGAPQLPEYMAGEDISNRTDEVFKYLFRASIDEDAQPDEEFPNEWLMTIHDSHVRLAAGVAEWRETDEEFTAQDDLALTTYALAQQLVKDPVPCVYEDLPY
jgi:hypothetical protein